MRDADGRLGQTRDTAVTKKPHKSLSEVVTHVGIGLGRRKRKIWREKFEKEGRGLQRADYGKGQVA